MRTRMLLRVLIIAAVCVIAAMRATSESTRIAWLFGGLLIAVYVVARERR